MGGASSWYAMLAITGFLTSLWVAGRASKLIGISSIVMEVAVGIVLGPQVAKLIPSELSECFHDQTYLCDDRKYLVKTANKGYKYCDLEAYLNEGKYTPGQPWYTGFWGNEANGNPKGKRVISGSEGGTYCLDPNFPNCTLYGNGDRRLTEMSTELEDASSPWVLGTHVRRLADDKKGKTDYDSYSECVTESCKLDVALKCATVPDIFTLTGHTGVAMMIFESGMHFDFEQAKTVGPWACAVAILGTFLPLGLGAALAHFAYGFDLFPDALSCGTALAPTSVGIALKLLHEAKALQTYFGQAVMTAAFVDDVMSLILFSVLFSVGGDITFMTFFPLLMGCVFMVVAIIACVTLWPMAIKKLFEKCPEYKPNARVTTHDEVMWVVMFLTLVAYGQITHICGTHLWGCFIAGMSFATQHHAHHVWVKQVKRYTCWFLRIFFGCTLAWSIPVKELFSLEAFWKGSIMGIGPCIACKVFCGPFMGSARWVIGWAMVGRAEFAYFIAILAKSVNMMDEKLFAILVWALIYATIFAPLVFRKVLARYMAKQSPSGEKSEELDAAPKIAHRISGHLPDLEQEEIDKSEQVMKEDYQKIKQELKEKDDEISELNLRIAAMTSSEKTNEDKTEFDSGIEGA